MLLRLERTGLIAAQWRHGGSGPSRKYYRITETGDATLRKAALDWRAFATGVGAVLSEAGAH